MRRRAPSALRRDARCCIAQFGAPTVNGSGDRWMTSRIDTSMSDPETLSHHTFEQAPIGIVYADRDGKVLRANPAFCQLLGFNSGELETKSIEELTHQADVEHNVAEFERLWRG